MGEQAGIVVIVGMTVQDGKGDDFVAAAAPCVEATRKEAGNVGYELVRDAGDPNHFVMIEHWKDQAAIDEHMKTPHLADLMTASGPLMAGAPTLWFTNPV